MTMELGRDKQDIDRQPCPIGRQDGVPPDRSADRRPRLSVSRSTSFSGNEKPNSHQQEFKLAWVPPGGVEETIPTRNLVSDWIPPAYLDSDGACLPTTGATATSAASRSAGNGTKPPPSAAIEFAEAVYQELWPSYRRQNRKKEGSDRDKLQTMLSQDRRSRLPWSDFRPDSPTLRHRSDAGHAQRRRCRLSKSCCWR